MGKRHPTIGNNVLIGCGAKVLGPFKVGDNSMIGANSVVLKEIEPGTTVTGVPGRPVKQTQRRVPSTDLDQVHLPDPTMQQICYLTDMLEVMDNRVNLLTQELAELRSQRGLVHDVPEQEE